MSELVKLTLESLRRRLSKSPVLPIQRTLGYYQEGLFAFFRPARDDEFEDFESTGLTLPDDYRYFLTQHNGAELFKDEETYDPSWFIFGLDEIEDALENYPTPEDFYVIAKYEDLIICVNNSYVKQGRKDYLFESSLYTSTREGDPIGLNFEIWLDRLITAQGDTFWGWKYITPDNAKDILP